MKTDCAAVAVATLILFMLAGCAEESAGDKALADATTSSGVAAPITAAAAPGAVAIRLDPLETTQTDSVLVRGSVDAPTPVVVRASRAGSAPVEQRLDAVAAWEILMPLQIGHNLVEAFTPSGGAANAIAVRLAEATVSAEFASAVPQRPPIEDTVWVDIDAFASAPEYAGKNLPHPPKANVHDVLVTWTAQTGTPVEYSYSESFGFGVESIDGHGALSDWCYDVNGESAPLGITGMEFKPGDVISWHGCFVV